MKLTKYIPSNTPSKMSGGTNEVLTEERKNTSFNVEGLTNILDGGTK